MRADADGLPLIGTHYETWKRACEDALRFMAGDARFDASRLGVLGFSLGGHYALGLAMDPPSGTAVRCVVDFFGPTLSPPLSGAWSNMPPLLIHHGLDDWSRAEPPEHLKAQLEKAERRTERISSRTYEHQGHGFLAMR
jgi:dienelactone hydrolase